MFTTPLLLEALRGRPGQWRLAHDLTWDDGARQFTVPKGFETDLASVPIGFRNVLNINGYSRFPAVLHDYLYRTKPPLVTREEADEIFRDALECEGVGPIGRFIYWAGVRLGGRWAWKQRR